MRNRITRRWLSDMTTPAWSDKRDDAMQFPSQSAARLVVRTVGLGPIPIMFEPV